MSEDEAFIRAIVASPGDDLPRLVYADYLDERDDPRGTYLRAELDPDSTGDTLYKLSHNLDAIWVLRVSRPPNGVCCNHLTFAGSGRPLTGADIAHAANQLRVQFPTKLRAFLLNYNGGTPSKTAFVRWWEVDRRSYTAIDRFLGLLRDHIDDLVNAAMSFRGSGLPNWLVPIAIIPDTEGVILLDTAQEVGSLFLWEDAASNGYNPDALNYQSDSLADFLFDLTDRPLQPNQP